MFLLWIACGWMCDCLDSVRDAACMGVVYQPSAPGCQPYTVVREAMERELIQSDDNPDETTYIASNMTRVLSKGLGRDDPAQGGPYDIFDKFHRAYHGTPVCYEDATDATSSRRTDERAPSGGSEPNMRRADRGGMWASGGIWSRARPAQYPVPMSVTTIGPGGTRPSTVPDVWIVDDSFPVFIFTSRPYNPRPPSKASVPRVVYIHGNGTNVAWMRQGLQDTADALEVDIFAYDYGAYWGGVADDECSWFSAKAWRASWDWKRKTTARAMLEGARCAWWILNNVALLAPPRVDSGAAEDGTDTLEIVIDGKTGDEDGDVDGEREAMRMLAPLGHEPPATVDLDRDTGDITIANASADKYATLPRRAHPIGSFPDSRYNGAVVCTPSTGFIWGTSLGTWAAAALASALQRAARSSTGPDGGAGAGCTLSVSGLILDAPVLDFCSAVPLQGHSDTRVAGGTGASYAHSLVSREDGSSTSHQIYPAFVERLKGSCTDVEYAPIDLQLTDAGCRPMCNDCMCACSHVKRFISVRECMQTVKCNVVAVHRYHDKVTPFENSVALYSDFIERTRGRSAGARSNAAFELVAIVGNADGKKDMHGIVPKRGSPASFLVNRQTGRLWHMFHGAIEQPPVVSDDELRL